jgi:starch-binding outer membrane protein, SusD/RagB family
MKSTIKSIIVVLAILAGTAGCVGDLDVKPIDPNVIQTFNQDGIFAKIYATLALTGSKGPDGAGDVDGIDEGTSAFYRMLFSLNQFPSDECWWVWADVGVTNLRDCSWDSSNGMVKGLYYRLYYNITLCNHFLDQTQGKSDDKTVKQRAEVRFLRALNYYYLLDMFKNVPHALTVSTVSPMPISRPDLYNWIINELEEIENDLFDDGAKPYYYRVDRVASWLLLSRIYLNAEVYTGTADWDNAALYASKVMNSSYTLAPVYKHLFMGDNDVNDSHSEIILPIAQDGIQIQSWGGSLFLIAGTRVNGMNPCGISEQWECLRSKRNLVEKFFPLNPQNYVGDENSLPVLANDDRCMLVNRVDTTEKKYLATLEGGATNGSEAFKKGWGIAKYSNFYVGEGIGTDPKFPDMDIPFMRASEAYLTYAEAVFRGGAVVGKSALDAVNDLRSRAHATPWTVSDLTLDNLLDEWSREFYIEGRRRTDLVRFGKFAGESANYNWEAKGGTATGKNVDSKYNIFPIPYDDIVANSNLSPTEGY